MEAKTAELKYISLDVVGYSNNRTVEAQTDIVKNLNSIVQTAVGRHSLGDDQVIYIPTGDGICIGLPDVSSPFDIHMLIALEILKQLSNYNLSIQEPMREFDVRIGLNENTDNLIIDINGHTNIAGAGINLSRRILDYSERNMIFVDSNVYERLRYRDKYHKCFRHYQVPIKHGEVIKIHQFMQAGHDGLDIDIPVVFLEQGYGESPLTPFIAYYLKHALLNEKYISSILEKAGMGQTRYALTVLLCFLALDSVEAVQQSRIRKMTRSNKTMGYDEWTFDKQLSYYKKNDFWICVTLADQFAGAYLRDYQYCFEADIEFSFHIVNEKGKERLKTEWPQIWLSLGMD